MQFGERVETSWPCSHESQVESAAPGLRLACSLALHRALVGRARYQCRIAAGASGWAHHI